MLTASGVKGDPAFQWDWYQNFDLQMDVQIKI